MPIGVLLVLLTVYRMFRAFWKLRGETGDLRGACSMSLEGVE
jgi:hypothetical protein